MLYIRFWLLKTDAGNRLDIVQCQLKICDNNSLASNFVTLKSLLDHLVRFSVSVSASLLRKNVRLQKQNLWVVERAIGSFRVQIFLQVDAELIS